MKKSFILVGVMLLLLQSLVFIEADYASAIPVFARKYKTSCSTCHLAIMKRNSFGEAFRKNGYRMPGDDAFFIKEPPVSLGAEAWKKKFPDAIWPSSIPAFVPIAFYGHQRANWKGNQWEMDTPHELEMLIGGVIGENISFFGEWLVWEEEKFGRERLGNLWMQFNDLLVDDMLNIRIGRHEIQAIESFKADNRLTLEHYNTTDFKLDGTFNLRTPQPGITVNGIIADRFEYVVGVVNGSNATTTLGYKTTGGTTSTGGVAESENVSKGVAGNTLEDNNDKDYYYRIAYKLGGMALTGPKTGDTLESSDNTRDDSIQIAQFGYFGQPTNHTFSAYGLDVRVLFSRYEIGAAYVMAKDKDQDVGDGKDTDRSAWFVEGQVQIFPWMFTVLRYEEENYKSDRTGFANDSNERLIFSLNMLQRANLKWTLEQVYFPRKNQQDGENTFKVNLMFAF